MERIRKMLSIALLGSFFLFPSLSFAGIDLPWSTTFNCTDWIQSSTLPCDGLELFGGWNCLPSGLATGGDTTKIIDTSVNFVNRGISVGNHVIVNHTATNYEEDRQITSITTTTNPNDTLNFSAMSQTCVSGDSYRIYDHMDGSNPNHILAKKSQITSDANNSSGVGGKGLRDYLGNGRNVGSGNLGVQFNSPQKEVWIRWYIRYPSGFKYNSQSWDKMLYWRIGSFTANTVVDLAWGNSLRFNCDTNVYSTAGVYGWDNLMVNGPLINGHRTGDGQWHCFEVHVKMDTTNTPGYDGVGQIWVDGVLRLSVTNANFSKGDATARQGWTSVQIKSNQAYPNNDLLGSYVDIDDVAISNTGYIGPVVQSSTTSTTSLPAPVNLKIVTPQP